MLRRMLMKASLMGGATGVLAWIVPELTPSATAATVPARLEWYQRPLVQEVELEREENENGLVSLLVLQGVLAKVTVSQSVPNLTLLVGR